MVGDKIKNVFRSFRFHPVYLVGDELDRCELSPRFNFGVKNFGTKDHVDLNQFSSGRVNPIGHPFL